MAGGAGAKAQQATGSRQQLRMQKTQLLNATVQKGAGSAPLLDEQPAPGPRRDSSGSEKGDEDERRGKGTMLLGTEPSMSATPFLRPGKVFSGPPSQLPRHVPPAVMGPPPGRWDCVRGHGPRPLPLRPGGALVVPMPSLGIIAPLALPPPNMSMIANAALAAHTTSMLATAAAMAAAAQVPMPPQPVTKAEVSEPTSLLLPTYIPSIRVTKSGRPRIKERCVVRDMPEQCDNFLPAPLGYAPAVASSAPAVTSASASSSNSSRSSAIVEDEMAEKTARSPVSQRRRTSRRQAGSGEKGADSSPRLLSDDEASTLSLTASDHEERSIVSTEDHEEVRALAVPSLGSLGHAAGTCKPCAFFLREDTTCQNGRDCSFCHLCEAGEKKRRRKERRIRARQIMYNSHYLRRWPTHARKAYFADES
eukprot:TRINITY_DN105141_c0_g1_i1.p1 TRINITY_DN105141_c0_g1~~TRINITY_DN105141_c0_g1_i1.p1  ORF type:complete len:421 (+),score=73.49 TRINITY_DN105141_c0_g1_i1:75-1337(+)